MGACQDERAESWGLGDLVWRNVYRVVEDSSVGLSSFVDLAPGRCHLSPGIVLLSILCDRRCDGDSFKGEEG